jgi:outer membrane protein TolC
MQRNRALGCAAVLLVSVLQAQTVPPEAGPQPTRAVQLPLSGRTGQAGGVATVQNPLPGGLQSVNTITSTVQVQGSYQGSIRGDGGGVGVSLSLEEALRRGLQYNLGPVGFRNAVRFAEAAVQIDRAALLPSVSTGLLVTEQQTNLAALGFSGFPGIPSVVGPFHYFDVRAGASQSLLDLTKLRNYRASQETVRAVELAAQDARDLVVLAVTGSYLQLTTAAARVEAARAQLATAQATYRQASDRLAAGVSPRIDVTRSQVELQVAQQRLNALGNDLEKLRIYLARLLGLPGGQEFTLADTFPYTPAGGLRVEQAMERAAANRTDLKSAAAQVRAAELARAAAAAERLPTISVSANYGVIGPSPTNAHGTFGVTGSVRLPVFQGGRVQGDIGQADATLQQRKAELEDLRGRIEAEIRLVFLDLNTASSQVAVAESNRGLARDTLVQAQDRFAAGVADTIEVVQAQEAVAAAEQDFISSLHAHNLAKATLARAMGQAEQSIGQLLTGR